MSTSARFCCRTGFLVRDLDQAMQWWRKDQGAGPWLFKSEVTADNYVCGVATQFVPDLDAAMRHWSSWRAMGPWFVDGVRMPTCSYRGSPSAPRLRKALANSLDSAEMLLELVEVASDTPSIFTDLIGAVHEGVHNVACWYMQPESTLDAKREQLCALGYQVVQSLEMVLPAYRLLHLEHPDYRGVFFELGEIPGIARAEFDRVSAAGHGFHGQQMSAESFRVDQALAL